MVIYNTKKNFIFIEFKQLVNLMAIKIKKVLVEAYNSIGLIKKILYTSIIYIRNYLKYIKGQIY